MDKIKESILEIADYYGYEAQSLQLVEECAELIQAVNKYRRAKAYKGQELKNYKMEVAYNNLVEEIADVEIMLEQIKYLLHIPEAEIRAGKLYKVVRAKENVYKDKAGIL